MTPSRPSFDATAFTGCRRNPPPVVDGKRV
jgi:hypothetical protein